jgi:hypothetical protein
LPRSTAGETRAAGEKSLFRGQEVICCSIPSSSATTIGTRTLRRESYNRSFKNNCSTKKIEENAGAMEYEKKSLRKRDFENGKKLR